MVEQAVMNPALWCTCGHRLLYHNKEQNEPCGIKKCRCKAFTTEAVAEQPTRPDLGAMAAYTKFATPQVQKLIAYTRKLEEELIAAYKHVETYTNDPHLYDWATRALMAKREEAT